MKQYICLMMQDLVMQYAYYAISLMIPFVISLPLECICLILIIIIDDKVTRVDRYPNNRLLDSAEAVLLDEGLISRPMRISVGSWVLRQVQVHEIDRLLPVPANPPKGPTTSHSGQTHRPSYSTHHRRPSPCLCSARQMFLTLTVGNTRHSP